LGGLDVLLEERYILEVVDVQEGADPRQQQLHLALNRRRLVLPGAPDVRDEQVELLATTERQLWRLLVLRQVENG